MKSTNRVDNTSKIVLFKTCREIKRCVDGAKKHQPHREEFVVRVITLLTQVSAIPSNLKKSMDNITHPHKPNQCLGEI